MQMKPDRGLTTKMEFLRSWPLLLGCTLGVAVGAAGLPFYTSGLFVHPLQHEFGWSLSQISFGSLVATVTIVLLAPVVGLAIDRFGVRWPAIFGLAALTLSFIALGSLSGSFTQYILIIIVMAALAMPASPISFTRAINANFHKSRGLALGMILSGTGITATFAPPVISAIIEARGWRAGYYSMAALDAVCIPVVLFLISLNPAAPSPKRLSTNALIPVATLVLGWRSLFLGRLFWRLAGVFFFLALGVSGFVLHLVPMLENTGLDPSQAANIQARLGIAVIFGRLLIGFLVDHFFAPRVAAISLCVTLGGIIALAVLGPSIAAFSAFAIGFALGAEVDLIGYLTARYFGLASYGRIYGTLYGFFVFGVGLSPLVIAELQGIQNSYTPALWACSAFTALAILGLATAPAFPNDPIKSEPDCQILPAHGDLVTLSSDGHRIPLPD